MNVPRPSALCPGQDKPTRTPHAIVSVCPHCFPLSYPVPPLEADREISPFFPKIRSWDSRWARNGHPKIISEITYGIILTCVGMIILLKWRERRRVRTPGKDPAIQPSYLMFQRIEFQNQISKLVYPTRWYISFQIFSSHRGAGVTPNPFRAHLCLGAAMV